MKTKTLRDWGERGLLRWLRSTAQVGRDTVIGIGDDCAMVNLPRGKNEKLLVASDAMVEGVHFRLDWSTPAEVGWKLAAVNISDIAAMGGTPRWLTVSAALPKNTPVATVTALLGGIRKCCRAYGVELVGGDVTGSRKDIFLDAAITGTIDERHVLRRDGAREGDVIMLVGECGLSALALDRLRCGNKLSPALRRRHCTPRPLLREGQWCAKSGLVTAMTDLSDSLYEAIANLTTAQGKGAMVELFLLYGAYYRQRGLWRGVDDCHVRHYQLTGGEDYALLITVPAKNIKVFLRRYPQAYAPAQVVGVVRCGAPELRYENKPWRGQRVGFEHFAK